MFLAIPGVGELWPILVIVLVIFGGRKLPELARAMGSSINQFKKGLGEDPDLLDSKEEDKDKDSDKGS